MPKSLSLRGRRENIAANRYKTTILNPSKRLQKGFSYCAPPRHKPLEVRCLVLFSDTELTEDAT